MAVQITVGRGLDVTYQLLSPNCPLMISRLHCAFRQRDDGQWTVIDKKVVRFMIITNHHCITKTDYKMWKYTTHYLLLCLVYVLFYYVGLPVCIGNEIESFLVCSSSVHFVIYSVTFMHPAKQIKGFTEMSFSISINFNRN